MQPRLKKSNVFLLIIYTVFFTTSFSQNIYLRIEGGNDKENRLIDSLNYVKQFKDINGIDLEKERLKKQFYELGYIENQEVSTTMTNDSTHLARYSLNTKYKSIHIYYNKNILSRDLLESISEDIHDDYFSLPFNSIETKLNYINQQIANQAMPFRSLQLKNIQKQANDILRANLFVSEGSERAIDRIVLNGYEKFPKSFLKHYLRIRLNDEFNLENIKGKTEALNELSFANQIKSPEVLFTEDSTTLYMYLEKSPSNTFDGFLGFGTNENTNKIEFDGYLNLNLTNNLNYGESFKLLYKSDKNKQKTFQGNIELPFIFGSPVGTELQLNIFKKDSSFTTVDQFGKIFYQMNSKSRVLVGISATQSNNLLDNDTSLLIDDYNSTFYNLGYKYVSRENYNTLFPINFMLDFEAGIGNRDFDDNDLKQTTINYDTFKIFNLNKSNSIFIRSTGSFLFSDEYLFNELYRFGGINSIRGFEENSLFASMYAVLNTEYRYNLSNNIYINSILDAAYFENDLSNSKEKLFGFGFGFGLLTNSGLLKLNYANGKSEGNKFQFSDSKIHISLTARF